MDASPFSPFVGRRRTVKDFKRRQSQLPSDLIDWDAPEIPELEKQRIIYEQIIQETNEDHAIEMLITEEIFRVAHEVLIETTNKLSEEKSQKDRSQINLLLNQIKMFESHSQELEDQNKELEEQFRDLEFHKQELEAEISCQLDTLLLKKSEADDLRKRLDGALCRLAYYKKLSNIVSK